MFNAKFPNTNGISPPKEKKNNSSRTTKYTKEAKQLGVREIRLSITFQITLQGYTDQNNMIPA